MGMEKCPGKRRVGRWNGCRGWGDMARNGEKWCADERAVACTKALGNGALSGYTARASSRRFMRVFNSRSALLLARAAATRISAVRRGLRRAQGFYCTPPSHAVQWPVPSVYWGGSAMPRTSTTPHTDYAGGDDYATRSVVIIAAARGIRVCWQAPNASGQSSGGWITLFDGKNLTLNARKRVEGRRVGRPESAGAAYLAVEARPTPDFFSWSNSCRQTA